MEINKFKNRIFEVEINGLRGIAVLLVLLFHYEIYPFSGGFIGVDIFFVISGYLIGKIIDNQELSFKNYKKFLLNRVRRIFPGLLVLFIISFIFFALILSPEHLINFSKSILSNFILIPNFYFWTQSNYFDISSNFKPFLHTWSLGVEYHFYIIWPIIIWAIKSISEKLAFKNIILILFVTISIIINTYIISVGPVFEHKLLYGHYVNDTIFFLSPFRIFEFIFGYFLSSNIFRFSNKILNEILFLIGILLIIYSVLTFDKNTSFPTINSLYPMIGAFLLIFCKNAVYLPYILRNKFINYFGNISFSLYLYHWPVIIFYKYLKFFEITIIEKLTCIIISIIFSHLSYHYVEKFYLNKKNNFYNKKTILASIVLIFFSFNAVQFKGWEFRLSEYEKDIVSNQNNLYGGFCDTNQILGNKIDCEIGDINNLDFLIVGDSHGQALYYGLKNLAEKYNFNIATHENMCGIYPANSSTIKNCKVDTYIPETIIISKKFYDYQMPTSELQTIAEKYANNIFEIKENKIFKNIKNLIVIGQVPEFYSSYGDLKSCYSRPYYINKSACDNYYNKEVFGMKKDMITTIQNHKDKKKLNDFMKNSLKNIEKLSETLNVYFFDPFDYFCDGEICKQVSKGNLIYSDRTHLSIYGSNFLINSIESDLIKILSN